MKGAAVRLFDSLRRRMRSLRTRDASNAALGDELRFHLERQVEENLARGMSPRAARAAAKEEFGSVAQATEEAYEARGVAWLDDLAQDARYGARTLRRNWSFTLVTVATLALGIGTCTAIFSVVNAVLLRSLPYGAPERLVYLFTPNSHFKIPMGVMGPSNADFLDLQRESHSFASMTLFDQRQYDLAADDQPQRVGAAKVDAQFFSTLQADPMLGRAIQESDEQPGSDHVVVLSYALWQSAFDGRDDAVGRTLRLNGSPYQVIGVMPPEFSYPNRNDLSYGDGHIAATQLWVPLALTAQQRADRDNNPGYAIARLKPGVTAHMAQAEMSALMKRLDQLHIAEWRGWGAYIEPFLDVAISPVRPLMWLLMGAVGFVLLIACGNAANLLLARAANRTHELGMRATLGARRGRLVRQMLTESLMLSGVAGGGGVMLAWLFLHVLLRLNPGNIPRMQEASLDLRVLTFLVFVSVLTGLLFGVLPSLTVTRIRLTEFLKSGGMHGIAGDRRRLRSGLAIAQVALVVMLLTGAGLVLRSYVKVLEIQTGFSASTVTGVLHLGKQYDTQEKAWNLLEAVLERVRSIHGVEATGLVNMAPLSGNEGVSTIWIEGHPHKIDEMFETRNISQGYLGAMQTPLLAGRDFAEEDATEGAKVAIINEAFATDYFSGESAVGQHLRTNTSDPWYTVVGVVQDVRYLNVEDAVGPQVYFPWHGDAGPSSAFLAVRSTLSQGALTSAIRGAIHAVDPTLSIEDVHAMGELESKERAGRRFQTMLLVVFAGMAMLLAMVGIYGLLAYSVRQRTGEIGLRMALGSSKSGVIRLVLREGLGLLGVGLLLGLAGAFACTRLLAGFLYGVPALDPFTFVLVPVLLFIATLAACLVPSWRAAAVDPMNALRHE